MEQQTALLVMDMQLPILQHLPDPGPVVGKIAEAISIARNNNIPVLYVTLAFRAGMPEIHPGNKRFQAFKQRMSGCADGDEKVHRVLTTKVFPRQASVITVSEWQPAGKLI